MLFRRGFCFIVICALLHAGCTAGDGKLKARGKVVKGGAPLKVAEDDFVMVVFIPVYSDGRRPDNTYIAQYDDSSGNFTVIGPDGRGLPPGKYRVSVEHQRKKRDLLKRAYGFDKTPFVFDVDSSNKEILIDLDKKS